MGGERLGGNERRCDEKEDRKVQGCRTYIFIVAAGGGAAGPA